MQSFATIVALVSVIPGVLSMTLNTPTSVVQCQPQLMTWTDGTPPFYLTVIPGGQPSAPPLKSFDTQSGRSMTWSAVDIPGDTKVSFAMKDSTGATAYTDMVTVQKSSDSSCLNGGGAAPAAAPPPASQASPTAGSAAVASGANDATIATVVAPAGSTTMVVAGSPATVANRPTTTALVQSAQSVSRATNSGTTASPATTSTSPNTSGAQSRFAVGDYLFVGAVCLLSAMFL